MGVLSSIALGFQLDPFSSLCSWSASVIFHYGQSELKLLDRTVFCNGDFFHCLWKRCTRGISVSQASQAA